MKNVLIPTDFSPAAMNAAEFAISLFGDSVQEYTFVHSYQTPQAGATMLVSINDLLKEEAEQEMTKMMKELKEKYPDLAHKMRYRTSYGDVAGVVGSTLRGGNYTLVVMGTTGASGLQDKLLGTNAANILRKSKVPVLALPQNARFKGLNRMTLAVDTDGLKGASDLAELKELIRMTGAQLDVVHVKKDNTNGVEAMQENLHDLNGIPFGFHTLHGNDVEQAIDRQLHSSHSDLLVMISRKKGFFQNLFHRSVSRHMAMHTDIPLLALHG